MIGLKRSEQKMGWDFKKSFKTSVLVQYGPSRIATALSSGIDKIFDIVGDRTGHLAFKDSQVIDAVESLFNMVGPGIWLGKGHPDKPAWVIDADPMLLGGAYLKDLEYDKSECQAQLYKLFSDWVYAGIYRHQQNARERRRFRASEAAQEVDIDEAEEEPSLAEGLDDELRSVHPSHLHTLSKSTGTEPKAMLDLLTRTVLVLAGRCHVSLHNCITSTHAFMAIDATIARWQQIHQVASTPQLQCVNFQVKNLAGLPEELQGVKVVRAYIVDGYSFLLEALAALDDGTSCYALDVQLEHDEVAISV